MIFTSVAMRRETRHHEIACNVKREKAMTRMARATVVIIDATSDLQSPIPTCVSAYKRLV